MNKYKECNDLPDLSTFPIREEKEEGKRGRKNS